MNQMHVNGLVCNFTRVILPLLSLALICSAETGFLNRTVKLGDTTYRYQVYVPMDWTAEKKWPVILFLHGAGERGDDGIIQTEVGMGGAIRRFSDRFPAIVVLPQCRKESWWSLPEMMEQAMAALDRSAKEFNGDTTRLYLTGLSMGGFGTWAIAAKYPGKFAAYAPVCGGIRLPARVAALQPQNAGASEDPYAETAKKVGTTPVWVFHGDADPVVPVSESRKMVEAIKAAGGNVRYSEYEGVGHNSWDRAYREPEFPVWLFSQERKGRAPAAPSR
ncbi:MAG: prolyl oligopeptidase family serine peptidase [Acidobacteria bacterium]|nr:prolyl oligopeptidase family serine peptidase [Acidobacteriota bacterium]